MSTKDYAYLIFCLLLNTFLLWTVLTRVEKLKKVQSYAVRINTDPPIILSLKVFLFRNRLDTSLIGGR